MALSYKTLTISQRNAIREALEKYEKDLEENPVTDAQIALWAEFTNAGLQQCLNVISDSYKIVGDKAEYLKGLDVLRIFYPEVDSPLFEAMREE